MTAGAEWSAWVQHDGTCIPVPDGTVCRCMFEDATVLTGTVDSTNRTHVDSWVWCEAGVPILAYRVRKPRGLVILEALIADLPAPVRESEDA